MTDPVRTEPDIPTATVRPRRLSTTWLIPLLALAIIGALVLTQVRRERGPTIEIRFNDAGGLTPGSEIIHRGVAVGVVRSVRATLPLDAVVVTAELAPEAERLAADGTVFWVVRPEVSLQRVSGLDTLIGPRYIGVLPGSGGPQTSFIGLDAPPALAPASSDALLVTLHAPRVGSLAAGSPVLYREIRVGTVRSAALRPDATGVVIHAEIDARYAPLVRHNSRFWRVGGVGLEFGLFRGLSVTADSLENFVSAAVAFATPEGGDRANPNASFELVDQPENRWLEWAPSIPLAPAPGPPAPSPAATTNAAP